MSECEFVIALWHPETRHRSGRHDIRMANCGLLIDCAPANISDAVDNMTRACVRVFEPNRLRLWHTSGSTMCVVVADADDDDESLARSRADIMCDRHLGRFGMRFAGGI